MTAGLKAGRQDKDKVIKQLKEQNKDLCESLDIMNNRESELLDMIEKMKCCGNCLFSNGLGCMLSCNNYDLWELAE